MCFHSDQGADETLARRSCRGCFTRLYERHRGTMARYVREAFLSDFDAALEIEDEAWKKAFEHRREYAGERPFRAWLLAIARNQALNHLRHARRAPPPPELLRPAELPPPDRAESLESQERCARIVRGLPGHLREPFFLRVVLDLSPGDIARLLRLPVSTIRGRLFRARKAIAELVREEARP